MTRKTVSSLYLVACLLPSCAPAATEPVQEPVAPMPSARSRRPDSAKGKGAFLGHGVQLGESKREGGRRVVKMAAELQLATDGDKCPSLKELIDGKKLDPNRTNDPWGNPYRVVCEDGDPHGLSVGRDGVAGTADDIRDDATERDLKRIGDL
jgi:hypothetical protein